MGNCMETYTMRQEEKAEEKEKQELEEKRKSSELVKINNDDDDKGKNNGLRVKVVLTKEELKWLILQLNEKGGNYNNNKRLEQVLGEIDRGREENIIIERSWKPSLESILEAPEIVEIER